MSVYKLIADATRAAQRIRGHSIAWSLLDSNRAKGVCVKCEMHVYVNTKPDPNEIEIAGDAIALNCNGSKA